MSRFPTDIADFLGGEPPSAEAVMQLLEDIKRDTDIILNKITTDVTSTLRTVANGLEEIRAPLTNQVNDRLTTVVNGYRDLVQPLQNSTAFAMEQIQTDFNQIQPLAPADRVPSENLPPAMWKVGDVVCVAGSTYVVDSVWTSEENVWLPPGYIWVVNGGLHYAMIPTGAVCPSPKPEPGIACGSCPPGFFPSWDGYQYWCLPGDEVCTEPPPPTEPPPTVPPPTEPPPTIPEPPTTCPPCPPVCPPCPQPVPIPVPPQPVPPQPPTIPGPVPPTCPIQPVTCPAPVVECPDVIVNVPEPKPQPQEITGRVTTQQILAKIGHISGLCLVDHYKQYTTESQEPPTEEQKHWFREVCVGSQEDMAKWDEYINELMGSFNPIKALGGHAHAFWYYIVKTIDTILSKTQGGEGCYTSERLANVVGESILGLINGLMGDSLRSVIMPLKYASNAACPVGFPSASEAVNAYIRGEIDQDLLKLWLSQNNMCWDPMERVVKAAESRLSLDTIMAMWRRGILTDEERKHELRRTGWVDSKYHKKIEEVTEYIPPITDLIRFMVRDVEDPNILDKFKLDTEFKDKWREKAKLWGRYQGISDEVALRYWRAHWRIPSPTQLFEMFHRSRVLDPLDPRYTSLGDVETALKQDDLLPYWVPKLIYTTYRRLTRVDAKRGFNIGIISRDRLKNEYIKLGYTDDDAEALTVFAEKERVKSVAGMPFVKMYELGMITEVEFTNRLGALGLSAEEVAYVGEQTNMRIEMPYIRRCITAIRKRYMMLDITDDQARTQLIDIGLSGTRVDAIINSLRCERHNAGKTIPATTLCDLFDRDIIDRDNFFDRLQAIGYNQREAALLVSRCSQKKGKRISAEAEKAAKAVAKEIERQQKVTEREAARQERRRKASQRALDIAEKARERRQKLLAQAEADLVRLTGETMDAAGGAVQETMAKLASDFLLTLDGRVQVIVLAVERRKPATLDDFKTAADEIAEEIDELGSIT